MTGSKNSAKKDWTYGRGPGSFRQEYRRSIKVNKRKLNRRVRHSEVMSNGCYYKKLAREAAYDMLT